MKELEVARQNLKQVVDFLRKQGCLLSEIQQLVQETYEFGNRGRINADK
jgi:hypothetical protein